VKIVYLKSEVKQRFNFFCFFLQEFWIDQIIVLGTIRNFLEILLAEYQIELTIIY